jgi:DNA-binding PadR family transcriptional regulator
MSLRYALLGMLAAKPGTGYEITRRFDLSLSNAWHASHSQIYPELGRLEEEGLAEVVGTGARNSRTYGVTAAGREELRRWLVEVEPKRNVRNESAVRWFLIMLLEPADRRVALERELDSMQRELAALRALAADADASGVRGPFRPVIDLGLSVNPVMQDWLRDRIERADEEPFQPEPPR